MIRLIAGVGSGFGVLVEAVVGFGVLKGGGVVLMLSRCLHHNQCRIHALYSRTTVVSAGRPFSTRCSAAEH